MEMDSNPIGSASERYSDDEMDIAQVREKFNVFLDGKCMPELQQIFYANISPQVVFETCFIYFLYSHLKDEIKAWPSKFISSLYKALHNSSKLKIDSQMDILLVSAPLSLKEVLKSKPDWPTNFLIFFACLCYCQAKQKKVWETSNPIFLKFLKKSCYGLYPQYKNIKKEIDVLSATIAKVHSSISSVEIEDEFHSSKRKRDRDDASNEEALSPSKKRKIETEEKPKRSATKKGAADIQKALLDNAKKWKTHEFVQEEVSEESYEESNSQVASEEVLESEIDEESDQQASDSKEGDYNLTSRLSRALDEEAFEKDVKKKKLVQSLPKGDVTKLNKLKSSLTEIQQNLANGNEHSVAQKATELAVEMVHQFSLFGVYFSVKKEKGRMRVTSIGNIYTDSEITLKDEEKAQIKMIQHSKKPFSSSLEKETRNAEAKLLFDLSEKQYQILSTATFAKQMYRFVIKGGEKIKMTEEFANCALHVPDIVLAYFQSKTSRETMFNQLDQKNQINDKLKSILTICETFVDQETEIIAAKKLRMFAVGWLMKEKSDKLYNELHTRETLRLKSENEGKNEFEKLTASQIAKQAKDKAAALLNEKLSEYLKETVANLQFKRSLSCSDPSTLLEIKHVETDNKQAFRRWKSDLTKFYQLCAQRPVLLFSSLSYHFLVRAFVSPKAVEGLFRLMQEENFEPKFWYHPEQFI